MRCENCKHRHNCNRQCMDLPVGKTCGDCVFFESCRTFCGKFIKRENTRCDFEPIKFKERDTND